MKIIERLFSLFTRKPKIEVVLVSYIYIPKMGAPFGIGSAQLDLDTPLTLEVVRGVETQLRDQNDFAHITIMNIIPLDS